MFRPIFVVLGLAVTASLHAQVDPPWWPGIYHTGDPHPLDGNYAPLLNGQAKNLADQARIHLNTQLPSVGGAGPAIETMVTGWASNDPNAYTVVTVGQLKALADKFYARLDLLGFNYKTQINNNGYGGTWTGSPQRPWNEFATLDSNYAIANVGQAKLLFSWDVTGFTPAINLNGDDDGDGLRNADELAGSGVQGKKDNPAVNLTVSVVVQ